MSRPRISRRAFLAHGGALAALALLAGRAHAAEPCAAGHRAAPRRTSEHPTPRAGIDASRVLTAEQLRDDDEAIAVFDLVRQIPAIADGIRCSCSCADRPGYRSLLSCFESPGMARDCSACRRTARLAWNMSRRGASLEEIRREVDRRA